MSKVHVKTGDTVVILSGKDRGKKGKIMAVSPKEGKVIVENANIVSKHVKPRKMGEAGGIIKAESAIYACKVQVVCPRCGKPAALEAEGYVYSIPGKGSFAAPRTGVDEERRDRLLGQFDSLTAELLYLGVTRDRLIARIREKGGEVQ